MSHGGDIYRNTVHTDLSVNLNPEGTPAPLTEAAGEGIRLASVYPDTEQEAVRSAIAAADGVNMECVFAGNGASELILASVRAVNPKTALLIEPCFSGYRRALESLPSCEIREMFLREEEDFMLTDEIIKFMSGGADMVFITDPWNPTGRRIGGRLLMRILEEALRKHIYVLLDQSFYLLSEGIKGDPDPESSDLIDRYDNLIIIRSYTKLFSLPGIRMGYVLSCAENVNAIRRQLPEWNLSSVSASVMKAGAEYLMKMRDDGIMFPDTAMIAGRRAALADGLRAGGYRVYPSDTVYLLFRAEEDLGERLLEKGILIRDCSDYRGLGKGFFRVAVKR